MVARSSVLRSRVLPGTALHFSAGSLELVKWLGVVAMLIEHYHTVALGLGRGWWFEIGRLAFPLFAVAFAAALSQSDKGAPERAAFRLFGFALAAQVGSVLVRGEGGLNVLFLFLAAGAWMASRNHSPAVFWGVRALSVVVAFFSEFGVGGLALVVSLVAVLQGRRGVWSLLWLVVAAVLLCLRDASPVLLLGLASGFLVALSGYGIPRVRQVFAFVYVLQFPVFAALRLVVP